MRSGLLHDHQGRLAAHPGVGSLRIEAGNYQPAKSGCPAVAIAVREEVARLVTLDLGQRGQVDLAVRDRPGERYRAPHAEVMSEMRIVDRNGRVELGEHAQKPRAPASRRAEDPDETTFVVSQAEIEFVGEP